MRICMIPRSWSRFRCTTMAPLSSAVELSAVELGDAWLAGDSQIMQEDVPRCVNCFSAHSAVECADKRPLFCRLPVQRVAPVDVRVEAVHVPQVRRS